jgi:hypothetical protein
MNTSTGNIVPLGFVESLKAKNDPTAKFYKEIPGEYLPMLQGMNRAQRREWYRKNKKLFKKGA